MTRSPHIACITNITPNHLDRHGTMEAYGAAKAHIFQHQHPLDVGIFGWDDPNARAMSATAPGRVAYFSAREKVIFGAYLDGDQVMVVGDGLLGAPGDCTPQVVCPRGAIRLRGDHNVLNVLAACAVANAAGIPVEFMRAAIESFTGVEHRQEPVAVIGGVTWVNDSIATAPERVAAALRSYSEPVVLLAGGRDKKLPWDELAALAAERCRAVIAFGEFGPQVVELMNRAKIQTPGARLDRVVLASDLPQAAALAAEAAQRGDVVLLSPGGTSYDAYRDFEERGQHFRDLVRALAGKS
jgi:UDP-N-acetylmuramoylalanine--D-glutamate ligase